MNKGNMMTAIVDACTYINAALARVVRKSKEAGMFTDAENNYIISVFGEMTKEGNQYIDKVKELLAPKQPIPEDELLSTLTRMYTIMRGYSNRVKKFEKDFDTLIKKRSKRLTDIDEIQRVFKTKPSVTETLT
ncbi:BAR domain-containing protein [Filimonas effusa]|uniref:Uncharacterized protein n=1 Tax=Filimonas effusa TaxID=2508721 RepID=A0A4Q1D2I2_9BACT|nr:hypothetical protein [Filimonas effusa]RXK81291.1 hypothetical protein ESB13_20355 [Filimonas effusa]